MEYPDVSFLLELDQSSSSQPSTTQTAASRRRGNPHWDEEDLEDIERSINILYLHPEQNDNTVGWMSPLKATSKSNKSFFQQPKPRKVSFTKETDFSNSKAAEPVATVPATTHKSIKPFQSFSSRHVSSQANNSFHAEERNFDKENVLNSSLVSAVQKQSSSSYSSLEDNRIILQKLKFAEKQLEMELIEERNYSLAKLTQILEKGKAIYLKDFHEEMDLHWEREYQPRILKEMTEQIITEAKSIFLNQPVVNKLSETDRMISKSAQDILVEFKNQKREEISQKLTNLAVHVSKEAENTQSQLTIHSQQQSERRTNTILSDFDGFLKQILEGNPEMESFSQLNGRKNERTVLETIISQENEFCDTMLKYQQSLNQSLIEEQSRLKKMRS
jgi:ribosomal protein L24E